MSKELIVELNKSNNIQRKLLARDIANLDNKRVFGNREYYQGERNRRRAYELFKRLIDQESLEKLNTYDKNIKDISRSIEERSGWYMRSDYYFWREDNFLNSKDPEFASHDTYSISWNENGYYVYGSIEDAFNGYYKKIIEEEIRFYERFETELTLLHENIMGKETIMGGDYTLKDEKNKELTEQISKYLNYGKERIVSKKNKK